MKIKKERKNKSLKRQKDKEIKIQNDNTIRMTKDKNMKIPKRDFNIVMFWQFCTLAILLSKSAQEFKYKNSQ